MTAGIALTLGWQLWVRQRWTTFSLVTYVMVLAVACRLPGALEWRSTLFLATVPLAFGVIFFVARFSYPEGDLLGCESSFPPDQYLLPVRTTQLVFWPMSHACLAAALAWLVVCELILRPLGVSAPTLWPAAMAAAAVACLQTLLWMQMALPFQRILLALVTIPGLVVTGIQAWLGGASAELLAGVFTGIIAGAYGVAVVGLARSRRGDTFEWRWPTSRSHQPARPDYASQKKATATQVLQTTPRSQLWFEWRSGGVALPLLTGAAFAVLSIPLLFTRDFVPLENSARMDTFGSIQVSLWLKLMTSVLLLPPALAGTLGFGRRAYHTARRNVSLHPFIATRPLAATGFTAARLQAAVLSTLVTWVIVFAFVVGWLLLPAQSSAGPAPLLQILAAHSPPATIATLILMVLILVCWTWKGLVQGIWTDLSGRSLLINGVPLVVLVVFLAVALASFHHGLQPGEMEPQDRVLSPWVGNLLGAAATLKVIGILVSAAALLRSRTLTLGRLALLTSTWILAVSFLVAALFWIAEIGMQSSPLASLLTTTYLPLCSKIAPAQLHSLPFLAGISVLFLPYSRIALIPLMISANRHG